MHGLGGGSRKSWSKTRLEDHFWPKSWLPRDPAFHNVRVHSFGYKSAKSEIVATISGVPDIAQSLLSAVRDSPALRHSQNAIILVGHSMGGLVIKKVSLDNLQDQANLNRPLYRHIAWRLISLWRLVSGACTSLERHTEDPSSQGRFKACLKYFLSFR